MPTRCRPTMSSTSTHCMLSDHTLNASTLGLTSKDSGGHHWIFPQGRDTGTIAVDYIVVQCNSISPSSSLKIFDKEDRRTIRKWRAHSVPMMIPQKVHKVGFDNNNISKSVLPFSSVNFTYLTEVEEYHSDLEDLFNSFLALSHNYRHLHRRTVSLPIVTSKTDFPKPFRNSPELPPLKLTGNSLNNESLMTENLAQQISRHLPNRLRLIRNWKLLFSMEQHGCALSTLFKMTCNKGPSVLAVRDACGSVFGAFITEHFKPSPAYYGGGECFLWKLKEDSGKVPRIKVYNRTGENEYFMLSENQFIAVGGGNGTFGLWLDKHLDRGFTSSCSTFDNEILATSTVFECVELEIWSCQD